MPNTLPPNPCLLGIVLVVRYKSEPRLVFHYPPHPGEDDRHFRSLFKDDPTDTSSTSSEDGDSTADDDHPKPTSPLKEDVNPSAVCDGDEAGSASPRKEIGMQHKPKPELWNDVLGLNSKDLAKGLSPARGSYRRFEMKIGNDVFLGRPVYAQEDGTWRKQRRPRHSDSINGPVGDESIREDIIDRPRPIEPHTNGPNAESQAIMQTELVPPPAPSENSRPDDPARQTMSSEPRDPSSPILHTSNEGAKDALRHGSLTMFHVVFVLRPPPLEYLTRIRDMHDHVVKKFAKALKWEQARSNYVANEVAMITSTTKRILQVTKDRPQLTTLYHDIIAQSSLAKAIATLYNGISMNRIAHVSLTRSLSLSLQIPIPASISELPDALQPQLPGLWLTTSTSIQPDDDARFASSQIGSHFTLLLLSDLHAIIADINTAATSISGPMTQFLQACKPTKSFEKISRTSGIALSDIQFLASHLIYWRRARAIPPLHQRDTYIVSPNADMQNLKSACYSFGKAFPTLPPLPTILGMLSTTPKPYSAIIRVKDHKDAYMDILAWLLRNGWVTQLRSFAWIKIPPNITIDDETNNVSSTISAVDAEATAPESGAATTPTESAHIMSSFHKNGSKETPRATILMSNPQISGVSSKYLSAISVHVEDTQGPGSRAAWDKCVKYFDGRHAIETIAVREGWKRQRMEELMAAWMSLGILVVGRHW